MLTPPGKNTSAYSRLPMLVLVMLLFSGLAIFLYLSGRNELDKNIFEALRPEITPARTKLMIFISFFGNHLFLVPAFLLVIIYLVIAKEKRTAWRVLFIALSSLLLMTLLKRLFGRIRPDDPLVTGITNFSFPSGHSFMSVTFFGLLCWCLVVSQPAGTRRNSWILFLVITVLLISFSRIYLRVHYVTDVMAGLGIGLSWLFACLWFFSRRPMKPTTEPPAQG